MKKKFIITLLSILVLGVVQICSAGIEYTVIDSGPDNITLEFDLLNDWGEDIDWFTIYFGETTDGLNFSNTDAFTNLSPDDGGSGSEPQPTGWYSYSFESSSIDKPAQFNSEGDWDGDGVAENTIAAGSTLEGFTVSFDWNGTGTYDNLYYEVGVLDTAWDYEVKADGYTELDTGGSTVPEPSTVLLFGFGILGAAAMLRKESLL